MFVHRSTLSFPSQSMGATSQLSDVRNMFVEWLRDAGVDGDRVDDMSVVVSELCANAIRETPVGTPDAELSARLDGATLEVTVTNSVSAHAASVDDWDLDDPLRTGGRGLLLVAAFVDDIHVDVVGRRLGVTCSITF